MKRRSLIKFFATIPVAIALPVALAQPALNWSTRELMIDQLEPPFNNQCWEPYTIHNIDLKRCHHYNIELTREDLAGDWMLVSWQYNPRQWRFLK